MSNSERYLGWIRHHYTLRCHKSFPVHCLFSLSHTSANRQKNSIKSTTSVASDYLTTINMADSYLQDLLELFNFQSRC